MIGDRIEINCDVSGTWEKNFCQSFLFRIEIVRILKLKKYHSIACFFFV